MKQINRFNRKVQKIIEAILCIASVIMLAVNLAQVIFRYVFHASILWSEELSTYLYVWIIFFSLYAACRERNELNIAVISFKNPQKMKIVNLIREFLGLITCVVLLAGSILMIQNALSYPQKTASLKIITAYLYFCMPVSFALLSWIKAVNIIQDILGRSGAEKPEPSDVGGEPES